MQRTHNHTNTHTHIQDICVRMLVHAGKKEFPLATLAVLAKFFVFTLSSRSRMLSLGRIVFAVFFVLQLRFFSPLNRYTHTTHFFLLHLLLLLLLLFLCPLRLLLC